MIKDGSRYRTDYRGDHIYVATLPVTCEVFLSSVKQDLDAKTAAAMDVIGRLIALAWQNTSDEQLLKQLDRSSRSKNDLPGIIAVAIRKEIKLIGKEKLDALRSNNADRKL